MGDEAERAGELFYHPDFPSRFLNNRRTLVVYLPPGYAEDEQRRYPVIYFHDGQNVFDPATAAFGVAWRADLTAERLMLASRIPPLVMVGVANTADRHDEYTLHFDLKQKQGGRGHLYGRFLLDEVKPFIDQTFRTKPQREHSAVIGSSLGGLVSLGLARVFHDHFALCGALSPALWWADGQLVRDLDGDNPWMRSMRFWLDMGTRESSRRKALHAGIERTRQVVEHFDRAGLVPGRDYYYQEVAGGEHNEAAWAARFDKVLLFFFGG